MKTDINKYVQDASGNVYKIIDSHLLKLSPCAPDKKYISEIENNDYHIISFNNACMIVNKQYGSITEHWNYNGKNYIANILAINSKDDIEEHTYRIRLLPDHSVVLDDEGLSELKLIRHKGKMYYILLINERLPRVKAYDLFGRFCQWVGIQHCKPVWDNDSSTFI